MTKVTLAHHWLTSYRGGERVLEQMAALFPGSDILTLVCDPKVRIPGLRRNSVHSSVLQRFPGATKLYRHLLPLHPAAIDRMQLPEDTELLLSSDAALIKGIGIQPRTRHVCYCHSPPRYLWELGDDYKQASLGARLALDRFAPALRRYDYAAAQRVTHFIANSHFVADRIARYYDRAADVIYPPVDVELFSARMRRQPFALVVSELVPYKRIDVAVKAFNRLGTRLVIIGDGPQRRRLQSLANSNVEFLGRQSFDVVRAHFETASMFIFPGIEDFGITAVEAQAAGCPVVALRAGGALETVVEGRTGAFFEEQTAESLAEVVNGFDFASIDPQACAANARGFSSEKFRYRLGRFLRETVGVEPDGLRLKSRRISRLWGTTPRDGELKITSSG